VRPYSPLELAGRNIYIREGCYACHSQQIRSLRDEVERYGHYSLAAESMYDLERKSLISLSCKRTAIAVISVFPRRVESRGFVMSDIRIYLGILVIGSSLVWGGTVFSDESKNMPSPQADRSKELDSIEYRVIDRIKNVRDLDSAKTSALSLAASESAAAARAGLSGYFPTVEVSLTLQDENKPEGGILVLKPLSSAEEVERTWFTQGSLYLKDGRTTVNAGIGYRRLHMDKTLLLGVNAFYDHEFPHHHGRGSLGFEARSTVGELNLNLYNRLSGWQDVGGGLEEIPVGGADVELGVPVPYMNWLQVYLRAFRWNSEIDGVSELKGRDLSLKADLPGGFFRGTSVEMGYRDYADQPNEKFITMSYNFLADKPTKTERNTKWVGSAAYVLGSMEEHRYKKVRRENIIVKQTRSTGNVTVGGF
jgi:hypothetical protein